MHEIALVDKAMPPFSAFCSRGAAARRGIFRLEQIQSCPGVSAQTTLRYLVSK